MPRYIILAQDDVTALALGTWLELLGEPPLRLRNRADNRVSPDDERCTVIPTSANAADGGSGVEVYDLLSRRVAQVLAGAGTSATTVDTVVLVDTVQPVGMDPLAESFRWDAAVAQLVLTFPEVHWCFGQCTGPLEGFPTEWHSLKSLATDRRTPLLDSTGLRSYVRKRANESLDGRGDLLLPRREWRAAAIDEEESYSFFHAYTAYRFGFAADAIRSWRLMEAMFSGVGPHGYELLFEDVNLNFPDKPERVHLSRFADQRSKACPRLGYAEPGEASRFRIIVTSGHSGADRQTMEKNREYVHRNKPRGSGFALKPVGGMFDLWNKARLFQRLRSGLAQGYHWPPTPVPESHLAGGHSAPGKLLMVAQELVHRAERVRAGATSTADWLHGAVLATDALELLRFQTPTLALQALSLKHEMEVRAEVSFLGVGHHFDVDLRLDELRRDVRMAAQFFERHRRKATELDALVSVGTRLMMVYRDVGQFDEEQQYLAHVRAWHRRLRLHHHRGPLDLLGQSVLAYAEYLLGTPGRFVAALALWYGGVFAAWRLFLRPGEGTLTAASLALSSFFATSPEEAKSGWELALFTIATLSGLLHLGILVSYLYSAVSRK